MIEKYELSILLEKYGINPKKIIDKNENILTYGEYIDINNTLDYLVNELNINIIYIEKCPSIMYLNVSSIKSNVKFLKKNKIRFSSVENCLHVLSTTPEQLEETYEYVERKYGVNAIEKTTSILRVPKDKIIDIENLNIPNINKNDILSIAVGVNDIKDIIKIIQSKEFKDYPELFTSQVLAHAKLEDIIKIINSEEFKKYPELFTSEVLARAKLEDIKTLLNLPYFKEEKYKHLLTSSLLANAKTVIKKLPILFEIAMDFEIDDYITTSYLIKSPSQNYAIISYLNDNNLPFVVDGKLNSMFNFQPMVLKKKYNIDLKEIMEMYPLPLKYEEGEKVK